MKQVLIALAICICVSAEAQNVGVGTTSPNAKLDISSTNSGVLIPRVALTATNAAGPVTSPVTSMMIYNTATAGAGATAVTPGFYYWSGAAWVRLLDNVAASNNIYNTDGTLTGNRTVTQGANNLTFSSTTGNLIFNPASTGNVGVGTASPNAPLTVRTNVSTANARTTSLTNAIGDPLFELVTARGATTNGVGDATVQLGQTYNGGAITEGFKFMRGIFGTDGSIAILTNSTERVRFTSAGNVGVGTSSPAYPLDVNGVVNTATGFKVAGGTPNTSTYLKGNGTNFVAGTIAATDLPSLSGTYVDLTTAQTVAGVKTWSNNAIFNANVGIGTTSPFGKFDYEGTNSAFHLYDFAGGGGGVLSGEFHSQTANGSHLRFTNTSANFWDIGMNNNDYIVNDNNNHYFTMLNSNGNVGIGTTAPLSMADIAGALAVGSYAGSIAAPINGLIVSGNTGIGTPDTGTQYPQLASKLYVNGPALTTDLSSSAIKVEQTYVDMGGTNGIGPSIMLNANNGYNTWNAGAITGTIGVPGSNLGFPGGLAFWTKPADGATTSAPVERLRITSSGYVGIGTSSPSTPLEVAGKTKTTTFQMTNGAVLGNVMVSDVSGNGTWTSPATFLAAFGTGTQNYLTKWNNAGGTTIGNSQLYDNGTNVGIGTTSPVTKLGVVGSNSAASIPNTTSSGVFRVGVGASEGIDFGKANVGPYAAWIQVGYNGVADPLAIQPLGGNVGIGTNNPLQKLDVNGIINAATGFKVAGGTPSTSTYLKGDGTNFVAGTIAVADLPSLSGTYVDLTTAQTAAGVKTWSNNAIFNGNVGIGTGSPNSLLTIGSPITSNLSPQATVNTTGNKPLLVAETTGSTGLMIGFGGNDIQGRTGANYATNGVLLLNRYGGNVGVGNTSPAQALDVTGVINASTGFKVNGGTPSTSTYMKGDGTNFVAGTIQIADVPTLNQNTTGSAASFTGSLSGDVTGTQGATTVGKINGTSLAGLATGILKNTTATGVPSIAVAADFPSFSGLYVDLAGAQTAGGVKTWSNNAVFNSNLSIGTTSTSGKLSVSGSAVIGASLTSRSGSGLTVDYSNATTYAANTDPGDVARGVSVVNEGNTANSMALLGFRVNPSGGANNQMMDMKLVNPNDGTSKMIYSFISNSTASDRFTMTSAGNLGIGTTSPSYPLDVTGVINASTGFKVAGGTPTSNIYLKGNGTNFVAGTIATSDIPSLSATYVDLSSAQTAAGIKTWSNAAVFNGGIGIGTPTIAGTVSFPNTGSNITWGATYTSIYDNANIHYWTDDATNFESGATGASAIFNWNAGVSATGTGGSTWMRLTNGNLGIGTGTTTVGNTMTVSGSGGFWNNNQINFYTDAGSTQKGYVGLQSSQDFMIAATTSGNWMRIGSNAANIAFFPDNTITAGNVPKVVISPSGFIGVGTTAPGYPIDVETTGGNYTGNYRHYDNSGSNSQCNGCTVGTNTISMYLSGRLVTAGSEIDMVSDRRIKDVIGISDPSADLARLMTIEVTDYRYKDVIEKGNKIKKAFIAQQVESVYPEAVSQGTDFIPDVYATATSVDYDAAAQTCTIHLPKSHEFSISDTIRIITATGRITKAIKAIPSPTSITLGWDAPEADFIFVYGKQVHDFRAVDYDRIFSLNVSATQELARRLLAAEAKNANLENSLNSLKTGKADASTVDQLKAEIEMLKAAISTSGK